MIFSPLKLNSLFQTFSAFPPSSSWLTGTPNGDNMKKKREKNGPLETCDGLIIQITDHDDAILFLSSPSGSSSTVKETSAKCARLDIGAITWSMRWGGGYNSNPDFDGWGRWCFSAYKSRYGKRREMLKMRGRREGGEERMAKNFFFAP